MKENFGNIRITFTKNKYLAVKKKVYIQHSIHMQATKNFY
jgi:hypothetical protein